MTSKIRPLVRRSRSERRVSYALKVVALVILSALVLWAVLQFIARVPSVSVIVIGAIFFTYIIYPIVRAIHGRGVSLGLSILATYAGIAAIVVLGLTFVLPPLVDDSTSVVQAAPKFADTARAWLTNPDNPVIARLPPIARTELAKLPAQIVTFAQTYAAMAAGRLFGFLASLFGIVATIVVIPVISIYLIFEAPTFLAALIRIVPEASRPKAAAVIAEMDGALGGFIRGQLTVGAVIGVCITVALLILHVKYALLIGVLAGLFDIIPYVGAIVGFVPSVLLALFNDGWQHAVIVAIVFVAIFQAEGHFISPRIVSNSVGLSPLSVIVAILIGGELGGIGGMFLAVPIAALIRVILLQSIPGLRTEPEPAPAASIAEAAAVAQAPQAKPARRASGSKS